MSRGRCSTVTGNMRPALSMIVGIHQAGQAGAVGGGGHRQQPQIGPQHALQVEAKSEAEVGFERAFVDLVQNDRGNAIQAGIGLQAAEQQALGDDLDPGLGRAGAVEAGAVADGAAHRLAEQEGHTGGGGAGSEAARFQHQDAGVAAPRRVKQRERHQRGLAGAGRGNEHGVAAGVQGGVQGGQGVGDGEIDHARGDRPWSPRRLLRRSASLRCEIVGGRWRSDRPHLRWENQPPGQRAAPAPRLRRMQSAIGAIYAGKARAVVNCPGRNVQLG